MVIKPTSTNLLRPATGEPQAARASSQFDKMTQDFEAMMLNSMLESMFKGLKTEGLFGGGHSEEMWRSFMLQEYAQLMAESGTTGIGKNVRDMLSAYGKEETPSPGQSAATNDNDTSDII